jgi:hypothetical protein
MPETVFHTDSRPPTLYLPLDLQVFTEKMALHTYPFTPSVEPFYGTILAQGSHKAQIRQCLTTGRSSDLPANTSAGPPASSAGDPHRRSKTSSVFSFLAPVASSHVNHGGCADVACPPATTTSEPVLSTMLEHPRPTSRHRVKSCLSFFRFLFVYRSMRRNCFSD